MKSSATDAAAFLDNLTPPANGTWQQERRARTRQSLLRAAHAAFGRSGYVGTTVDDILKEAGVGRTSFYKHFNDKLALASDLFEAFMPSLEIAYEAIAGAERIDTESVSQWLHGLIDDYERHRGIMTVFAEVMVIEPGFGRTIAEVQRNIMKKLGRRFPAFLAAANAADARSPDRTQGALILDLIDSVCAAIALRRAMLNRDVAVGFVGGNFLRFVRADR